MNQNSDKSSRPSRRDILVGTHNHEGPTCTRVDRADSPGFFLGVPTAAARFMRRAAHFAVIKDFERGNQCRGIRRS